MAEHPPYPRWVGGLPQVGGWSEAPIQKMVIGESKSANLPPLGLNLKLPTSYFIIVIIVFE